MGPTRLLLDTTYIEAYLNRHDQHHENAKRLRKQVGAAFRVFVTEAVLLEVGNALSSAERTKVDLFIRACYTEPNMRVIPIDTTLMMRGLDLFRDRPDKQWRLTDCISFEVLWDNGLTEAVTADRHFVQAGFRALMLEES